MTMAMPIRDVSLNVRVVGSGYPLVLMHGGPSADLWTLSAFRHLAGQFTLIFYDHRGNGRSTGAAESMTWENLTADADALRARLGFARWAVLGHSFGGHVALEYALRYPDRLSQLVLLDTGGDSRWARENASQVFAERGLGEENAGLVRRWFHGDFEANEYRRIFMRIGKAYNYRPLLGAARILLHGAWRSKSRPDALIFAGRRLLDGWTVMDRLGEITVPTLVIAGRQDFVFPPQSQRALADAIPGAQLRIIDRAGHNPHDEQTDAVMTAVRQFLTATTPTA
ncbi:alpha/beta hydrolase [Amycolatopsis sp. K13G38]|uniref:Alpha/beta hydrolase n=1 Tax=Amycolatopsis acididurans TaxID=2724524 RepID=A0ABX1JAZ2_9PSEU|nr:alpha/beta hydrolase [Amycolatopsis acididurans]NKQ56064.1 alpha/beta hydrolase [Amycolatopsis acididurans]